MNKRYYNNFYLLDGMEIVDTVRNDFNEKN